jgi:ABC-2 type transport system ATP-binding protein
MNDSFAIQTQGLTKSYGKVQALRGVDLEVRRGEVFGFLGPNGSGKTTTIRCLLDLIRPDGGTLRAGRDPQRVCRRAGADRLSPGELHRRVIHGGSGAAFLQPPARRSRRVDLRAQLADRLSLDLQLRFKNLSKGNKQKVGIVQALMHRPALLMLDEPTSGLDPLIQRQVLSAIREAQGDGATVFFSSHVLSEVEEIADRVGIIRRGGGRSPYPQALIDRALRRVRVRFKQPIDLSTLAQLPGVTLIDRSDGASVLLNVAGDMDQLIKTLAAYPVIEVDTERPSLEEIFLAYYAEKCEQQFSLYAAACADNHGLGLPWRRWPARRRCTTRRWRWGINRATARHLPSELMMFIGGVDRVFSPAGFLDTRFFSMMPLLLGVFAVIIGSGLIAGDEENGTLDLILAHPVRRFDLIIGRWLAFCAPCWHSRVTWPADHREQFLRSPGWLTWLCHLSAVRHSRWFGGLALLWGLLTPRAVWPRHSRINPGRHLFHL